LVLSHFTVVTVVTVLLAGSGSVSFAVTVAVLLKPPGVVGLTRISRTALSPSLILPMLQVTMLLEREQPEEAETKFTFAGRVSVTITPVAFEGPKVPDPEPVGELTAYSSHGVGLNRCVQPEQLQPLQQGFRGLPSRLLLEY
jgi:hypothetical protein